VCFVIIDFSWDYFIGHVFDSNPHSVEELKTNTKDAVSNFDHSTPIFRKGTANFSICCNNIRDIVDIVRNYTVLS
jgi:hypothetical protein